MFTCQDMLIAHHSPPTVCECLHFPGLITPLFLMFAFTRTPCRCGASQGKSDASHALFENPAAVEAALKAYH